MLCKKAFSAQEKDVTRKQKEIEPIEAQVSEEEELARTDVSFGSREKRTEQLQQQQQQQIQAQGFSFGIPCPQQPEAPCKFLSASPISSSGFSVKPPSLAHLSTLTSEYGVVALPSIERMSKSQESDDDDYEEVYEIPPLLSGFREKPTEQLQQEQQQQQQQQQQQVQAQGFSFGIPQQEEEYGSAPVSLARKSSSRLQTRKETSGRYQYVDVRSTQSRKFEDDAYECTLGLGPVSEVHAQVREFKDVGIYELIPALLFKR